MLGDLQFDLTEKTSFKAGFRKERVIRNVVQGQNIHKFEGLLTSL